MCGSFDIGLSRRGRAEVDALLQRIKAGAGPDALLTSTLLRAREVAEALGRTWNLSPQPAAWAREIHCGDMEGVPFVEIQRTRPELWDRNEAQADDAFAWPGGESYTDFRTRIMRGLQATAAAHPGRRVAIVTHAGVISQILGTIRRRRASAWAPDRPGPLTATEILWYNGAPTTVLSYNDADWDPEALPHA